MKHIHAELMAEYAKDAMETDEPWLRWEFKFKGLWITCNLVSPLWEVKTEYRRKARTININGHEVPEPYRGEMQYDQLYYIPSLDSKDLYYEGDWCEGVYDKRVMERGLVHLTKEAAIKHTEALLSFTQL